MSVFNLQASFFSIENPLRLLDRYLNRFRYRQTARLNQREVEVRWTNRAECELQQQQQPLIVELQLYFSCIVKKRVLFHQSVAFDTTRVNDQLKLFFRPIAAAACDPWEFATHYPAGQNLSTGTAARMVPGRVEIDYRQGHWEGQFYYYLNPKARDGA